MEVYTMNCLALTSDVGERAGVIRDADGVPVEWTLLRVGDNPICQEGRDGSITLRAEDMRSIVEYHHKKGELIPVDSEHYLFALAQEKALDEAEALRLFPGGVAALGYGALALSGDELRVKVQWTPAAHGMLKEKIYKYFSPVLRGLDKPPLRVTSVAMTNTPAINNLDALAASAIKPPGASGRKAVMGNLEKALARLTGRDAVALEAENEKERDAVAAEVEEKASIIEQVRSLLKLGENATLDEITAALKAELEKAASADAKQAQLDELAAAAEKKEHAALVARGRSERKITDADMEYVNSLDAKALSAYLDHTSAKFPAPPAKTPAREPDTAVLTAEERGICRRLGIAEADFVKEKNGK